MTEHIYKRLDELGEDQVRHLQATAGLPEGWRPHILQWLAKKGSFVEKQPSTSVEHGTWETTK